MDARCFGNVCEGVLETQTVEESVMCTIPQTVVEDVDGCRSFSLFFRVVAGLSGLVLIIRRA